MTDKQKQKRRDYQKECVKNMTDEQKQKYKDYRREYFKKYYSAKKLNNNKIIDDNDNDNKIIDNNESDNDNDFYYILNNHKIFKCVLISIKQKQNNFCLCISSVKWDHMGNFDPNSTNTISPTNPVGSSGTL